VKTRKLFVFIENDKKQQMQTSDKLTMNKNIQFFLILFHDVHSSAVMDVTSKAKFSHS